MARPKPLELLVKFFPELVDKTVASSNKEASKELNVRICEAIISDLISKHDKLYAIMGEGALIVNLKNPKEDNINNYVTVDSLERDLVDAMNSKDTVVEEFIQDALRTIKDSNANQHIVILFLDNSGGSVSRIMRDMPAKKIQEMMDDL
tara:strand:- start:146 stop:592 length:447 start_codon:yes stop_codon:yes gene_type:complete